MIVVEKFRWYCMIVGTVPSEGCALWWSVTSHRYFHGACLSPDGRPVQIQLCTWLTSADRECSLLTLPFVDMFYAWGCVQCPQCSLLGTGSPYAIEITYWYRLCCNIWTDVILLWPFSWSTVCYMIGYLLGDMVIVWRLLCWGRFKVSLELRRILWVQHDRPLAHDGEDSGSGRMQHVTF